MTPATELLAAALDRGVDERTAGKLEGFAYIANQVRVEVETRRNEGKLEAAAVLLQLADDIEGLLLTHFERCQCVDCSRSASYRSRPARRRT